jgi:hypothetical protein
MLTENKQLKIKWMRLYSDYKNQKFYYMIHMKLAINKFCDLYLILLIHNFNKNK